MISCGSHILVYASAERKCLLSLDSENVCDGVVLFLVPY